MSKPMVKEFNVATGEEITREMTNEEFAQYEKDLAALEAASK